MLKKSTYYILLVLIFIKGTSSFLFKEVAPPVGATGAPGPFGAVTCGVAGCHTSFAVNTGGGNVSVSGLPTTQYVPGAPAYNFTLKITHGTADRTRWGFSIVAKKADGTAVGIWASTNPTVAAPSLDLTELQHFNAPVTTAQNSYTFTGLKWTPPATNVGPITFYYAAVAANNDLPSSLPTGDYVYTAFKTSVLPVKLSSFNASVKKSQVLLSWQTAQELNSHYFTVQKSLDNRQFIDIGKVYAAGNSSVSKNYSFTDENPSYFEKPIFYRLAMVDKDGSKEYSSIENVILKTTATFIKSIYPNPLKAGSVLNIDLVSQYNEVVQLKLIDNNGSLIKVVELTAAKGSNNLNIKLPLVMSAGNYKLIIKNSTGLIQQSIVIQ